MLESEKANQKAQSQTSLSFVYDITEGFEHVFFYEPLYFDEIFARDFIKMILVPLSFVRICFDGRRLFFPKQIKAGSGCWTKNSVLNNTAIILLNLGEHRLIIAHGLVDYVSANIGQDFAG